MPERQEKVVELLKQASRTAKELAKLTGTSVQNINEVLRRLRKNGHNILTKRKRTGNRGDWNYEYHQGQGGEDD